MTRRSAGAALVVVALALPQLSCESDDTSEIAIARAVHWAPRLVSHSLDQVFRLADRICVLRRGTQVGIRRTPETTGDEIVSMITGLR